MHATNGARAPAASRPGPSLHQLSHIVSCPHLHCTLTLSQIDICRVLVFTRPGAPADSPAFVFRREMRSVESLDQSPSLIILPSHDSRRPAQAMHWNGCYLRYTSVYPLHMLPYHMAACRVLVFTVSPLFACSQS